MRQHLVQDHKGSLPAGRQGYAMVVLLVFVIMSLTMISAAVNMMLIATQATSEEQLSRQALGAAESGIEEALLRTLRNPNYTGGALTLDEAAITIIATGSTQKTITSHAAVGSISHEIDVIADYEGVELSIPSWSVLY